MDLYLLIMTRRFVATFFSSWSFIVLYTNLYKSLYIYKLKMVKITIAITVDSDIKLDAQKILNLRNVKLSHYIEQCLSNLILEEKTKEVKEDVII